MKKIQPIDEAAVREARDSNTKTGPATPRVDVNAIYRAPGQPAGQPPGQNAKTPSAGAPASSTATPAGAPQQTPAAPGSTPSAPPQPAVDGSKAKIALRESSVQLYAVVLGVYCFSSAMYMLYGLYRVFHIGFGLGFDAPLNVLALLNTAGPFFVVLLCVFLLLTKKIVLAKAALILIGLNLFATIAYGIRVLFYAPSLTAFALYGIPIFFFLWLFNVYRNVSLLET